MITVAIMKKNYKTRAGIFKNMSGNIPGGNFPEGTVFLILKQIYGKNSQVYMHSHRSSPEKFSLSKPIASVFLSAPIIFFSMVLK